MRIIGKRGNSRRQLIFYRYRIEIGLHKKAYIAQVVLVNMRSVMIQKIALFIGIILILIVAVLLIGNLDSNVFPVFMGLLGIIVIGVFFLGKRKKWIASKK